MGIAIFQAFHEGFERYLHTKRAPSMFFVPYPFPLINTSSILISKVRWFLTNFPWQIIGTISDCLHLKVNLVKNIYLYVNFTTQWCPHKIIETFLIEDFFHLTTVSTTQVVHLELRTSPRIFERKNWNGPNGILRDLGELIHEKNLKSKILWHCPF